MAEEINKQPQRKIRFTTKNRKEFSFEDGSKFTVKASLDYKTYSDHVLAIRNIDNEDELAEGEKIKLMVGLVKGILLDWTFVDEKGEKVECTQANIEDLDIETLGEIVAKATPLYTAEKKS